ncbi:signal peptidase I [Pseudodesulfovibrio senegalensis]|jgi:signal peptidase I|uniref:Signal peptidase I n=1 Tax=Pseudodesulfovibrio senegalensis TaxID=1721087 RepID=A0A6N6N1T6_9BACT|nr:signal peptidase I [Pseudodesulfovibrio senegalensis]KAB1441776.1 signal peptidase I [Pseudodesulfovibrio senegalensis]
MSRDIVKSVRETFEILVVALVLAFFIRTFVVQAFKIPSGSMLETLQIGDHLLVSKFLYGIKLPFSDHVLIPISDPQRGDVIVFKYPENPDVDFIKRVVAVPGDTVEIRGKKLYVNGKLDKNPHANHKDPTVYPKAARFPDRLSPDQFDAYFNGSGHMSKRDNMPLLTVPKGKYFVMGDNRDGSHDSRFWGFVDREAIIGKAIIIHWSWASFTDVRWSRIGTLVK